MTRKIYFKKNDLLRKLRRRGINIVLVRMADPANLKNHPLKHFAAWLTALFLVVLGAKLWVVELFGSPLPLWDQWYEAGSFLVPWVEGHLTLADFFAPDNEHRIVFTRLLDLIVIRLNGRWEPLLQMTVNAVIHASFACALAFCLWDFLGPEKWRGSFVFCSRHFSRCLTPLKTPFGR